MSEQISMKEHGKLMKCTATVFGFYGIALGVVIGYIVAKVFG